MQWFPSISKTSDTPQALILLNLTTELLLYGAVYNYIMGIFSETVFELLFCHVRGIFNANLKRGHNDESYRMAC